MITTLMIFRIFTLFLLFYSANLLAIPSPDLVINLFASLGQLLGMLSVAFGGAALSLRKKKKKGSQCSPWPFRITVGLFLLSAVSFAMYAMHKIDLDNVRLQANLTRSSTENGAKVGDVSLKTLSFSDQKVNKLGMSTAELEQLLIDGVPLEIIDVREREETEAGMIVGAKHNGYPDLLKDHSHLGKGNKKTVLLCFSGNRSSELCTTLSKQGVECSFMVGGYEKWLAEGRKVNADDPTGENLRSLPYYPNKEVLLETQEVEELVSVSNAQFVDVRYPGDFKLGHLPGAVNIPLRKMTQDEALPALNALPKDRPVIAPCYDKRSCFYGQIIGLRLHRLGYDYLGRYTVPHEYTKPLKVRSHVQAWKAEQEGKTLFGVIGVPLKWILYKLKELTHSFIWAIFVTVLALRFVLLPFSAKIEIDRLKESFRAPQVKALKKRFSDHPQRLQRAMRKIAREDKPSPMFNMLGNIAQLILFLVLFTVISDAANDFGSNFYWIDRISDQDPLFILPVLVSLLILLHMMLSMTNPTRFKKWMNIGFSVLILALTLQISAALNIYLVMSLGLLTIQGILIRQFFHWREARKQRENKDVIDKKDYEGIVPLIALREDSGGGNKGLKLGEMLRAGLPVPDGFTVTADVLAKESLSSNDKKRIESEWKRIKAKQVAVRSSGLNEDGEDKSYAGVFESILEVPWDNFYAALAEVQLSFSIDRAASYSGIEEVGGIVVQKMVDAEYAGVMFTEHPSTSGSTLIELVAGLGEALVSGQATPDPFQFGRYSGIPMFDEIPPIDLKPLLALGRKIEAHFGRPQDIEWAYADGEFYMLQTRDITSDSRGGSSPKASFERERFRILELFKGQQSDSLILKQNALSELMPTPSRLSLSVMDRIWGPGGSVDLACSELGIPYEVEEDSNPYVLSCFGAMFINNVEEGLRLGAGPGMLATFKLSRAAENIEKQFLEEFLPNFINGIELREAIDFRRYSVKKLVHLFRDWTQVFITEVYLQAELVNVSAEYYMQTARTELEKKNYNASEYLGQVPQTVVNRAMSLLPKIKRKEASIHDFLHLFGHRAPKDFEFSMPRYKENLNAVAAMVESSRDIPEISEEYFDETGNKVLDISISRARKFQFLKEETKHHCLRHYALLRQVLMELDRKLVLNGGIFNLDLDEVYRLADGHFKTEAFGLSESRIKEKESFQESLPLNFNLMDLETYGLGLDLKQSDEDAQSTLRGLRISGAGEGFGRVRVLHSSEELVDFEEGEILVARFTDPTWTPAFSMAAGVVTEVGGWLSHAAILARELNVVGIVGAANATRMLKTGDTVRLFEDGTIEVTQTDRRSYERFMVNRESMMWWDYESDVARIIDVSRKGILLEVEDSIAEQLDIGKTGSVLLVAAEDAAGFEVVRKEGNQIGVVFQALIDDEVIDLLKGSTLEEEIRRTQDAQGRLLQATLEVHNEDDFEGVLQKILSTTTQLMQADRSSLFLHDADNSELYAIMAEGTGGKEIRFPFYMGIAGNVFVTSEMINIPDAYKDNRFNREVDKAMNYRTRSLICCPVMHGDKKIGVIQVLNKAEGSFNQDDEAILWQYAEQSAIALMNAKHKKS